MKGNPDGSLSNYPSLRTLKASGFIDSLNSFKHSVKDRKRQYLVVKTKYRQFFCRTPVQQLPYVSNVLTLSYWKLPYMRTFIAVAVTFLVGGFFSCGNMMNNGAGAVIAISIMGGFILSAIERNKES